jgi:hypothetical protein
MARRNNGDDITQSLVAIDAVAGRCGMLPEFIWQRLDPADVHQDWSYTYCVSPTKARELVDAITTANEAHNRAERERQAKQMEDELRGRRRYVDAYEDAVRAGEKRVPGVVVSAPGEAPEPGWMSGAGGDE